MSTTPEKSIPLASSFPVIESLTPRARRRATLEEKAEAKKKANSNRAEAAAVKRANLHKKENDSGNSNETQQKNMKPMQKKGMESGNETQQKRIQNMRTNKHKTRDNATRKPQDNQSAELIKQLQNDLESNQKQLEERNKDFQQLSVEHETNVANFEKQKSELNAKNSELAKALELNHEETRILEENNLILQDQVSQLNQSVEELNLNVSEFQKVNKELRNQVLELKGNIRVFARVRPALDAEESAKVFDFPADDPEKNAITLVGESKEAFDGTKCPDKKYDFSFDRVFHEYASQNDVFDQVTHLVQSSLDGYNVCIFAYGQTGSGKTFTMEGENTEESLGIIPRTIRQLFAEMSNNKSRSGWTYALKASFLEIYNETIRDLSCPESEGKTCGDIRHQKGETKVAGANEISIESPEELYALIKQAKRARVVSATKSNERSSRSHSVFILSVTGTHASSGEVLRGVLNLVDL